MPGKHLLKCLLFFFVFGTGYRSRAQYTDLGTGTLKDKIWWIDRSGFSMANGAARTFTTTNGPLVVDVSLDHSGIQGQTGLAFGVWEAVDRGDLSTGYGYAQHRIRYTCNNGCNYLPSLPGSTQDARLKPGALPGYAKDGEVENYLTPIPQNVAVAAGFIAPDTVCINTPVNITNTSTNASSFYWNFCVTNAAANPVGTNTGNFGFSLPVFMDYAKDGNNYYAFVTNNIPGALIRLDFGNSLLNAPTYTNLGNFGGVIPNQCEGIQVVQNEGKWYAIIVGGMPVGRILKVEFGASLANNSPVAVNWGNIGDLAYPTDLQVFQEGANWYGLTINWQTSSVTRFSFTNSFNNTPTGVNLGNLGGLNYPTGMYALNKNGNWYAFVINTGTKTSNSTDASLTRLDFGTSLLNLPTGTNLGNPGNTLGSPRDLTFYQSCNEIFGYVVSNATGKELVRLNFNNSITAVPTTTVIGNTGNLNFPHAISKLFRDNSDLYAFVTNVNSNSLTRLKFPGCNNSSLAGSTLPNPPPVTYNTPGTYDITLTVDDGLPTQSAFCKQIVVISTTHTALQTKQLCEGDSVLLTSTGATGNQWNTGSTAPAIYVKTAGTYWVQSPNGGCVNVDSFAVNVTPKPVVDIGKDTALCVSDSLLLDAGNAGASYLWQNGQTSQTIVVKQGGLYYVTVTKDGCFARDSITLTSLALPVVVVTPNTNVCKGSSVTLTAGGGAAYSWSPPTGLSGTNNSITVAKPDTTTKYYVTVTGANSCKSRDSVTVTVFAQPSVNLGKDTSLCTKDSLLLDAGNAGASYLWQSGQTSQTIVVKQGGLYYVTVTKNGCSARDSITLTSLASPVVSITPNTNVCKGSSVTLTAGGGATYSWSPATGLSGTNNSTTVAKPDTTTKYYVVVTSTSGCQARDSVTVTVLPQPSVNLGKDTSLCTRDSLLLDAGNAGASYLWQNGQTTQTFLAKSAGTYYVAVSKSICVARDTITISPLPSPVISVTNNTSICRTASVLLQASGAATYKWWPVKGLSDSTGATVTARPDTTTTFYLLATGNNGCTAKDSVRITVTPLPVFSVQSSKPTLCFGDTAVLSAQGGDRYTWSPALWVSNPYSNTTAAFPPATTLFNVVIVNSTCNIVDTLSLRLPVADKPITALTKSNDINCVQAQATLTAAGGVRYLWQPSTGLSDSTSRTPVVTIGQSTTYRVIILTAQDCVAEDSITVYVNKSDDGNAFPVPSAFTPNNDGKNDCFGVPHWGAVTAFSLTLYNRWGERIFHADNPSQCWNGIYKGVPQPGGVYVYWIKAKSWCGEVFRKGTFALIR